MGSAALRCTPDREVKAGGWKRFGVRDTLWLRCNNGGGSYHGAVKSP
jgi:hypothetical protein